MDHFQGEGRRTRHHDNHDNHGPNQRISDQIKHPSTIDVRFDKRGQQILLNQNALERYQENTYLFGRIFSNENDRFAQQQAEESYDEDDLLGMAMTEQRTAHDEEMSAANPEDEEVNELKEYLTELREQFKVT